MSKNSNRFLIPFFIVIIMVIVAGCTTITIPPQEGYAGQEGYGNLVVTQISCPIFQYGNGVMIFNCDEITFAETLSNYISENNVTVTAITGLPNKHINSNRDIGYLVVVK